MKGRRSQRGAVLVISALTMVLLALMAGLALDFGRAFVYREQLQTAVDAAALAGAGQAEPWLRLWVPRRRYDLVAVPCGGDSNETCSEVVVRDDPIYLPGAGALAPETYLLWERWAGSRGWEEGHWYDDGRCGLPPGRFPRWECGTPQVDAFEFRLLESAHAAGQRAFTLNATWPRGPAGAGLMRFRIEVVPQRAEVTATATLSTATTLLRLAGLHSLEISRRGVARPVRTRKKEFDLPDEAFQR